MSVVSVYTPTARTTPGVKAKLSNKLQNTLDKVPTGDVFVVLGDFNASVGVLKPAEEQWQWVLGR